MQFRQEFQKVQDLLLELEYGSQNQCTSFDITKLKFYYLSPVGIEELLEIKVPFGSMGKKPDVIEIGEGITSRSEVINFLRKLPKEMKVMTPLNKFNTKNC
jgi:hypothetical protein